MKRLVTLLAAMIFAVPAFAQEPTVNNEFQESEFLNEQLAPADQIEELLTDDEALNPRLYICVARNRFGQRFQGRDRRLGRAQFKALRKCRVQTPWNWHGCRLRGCVVYQTGNGNGTGPTPQ